MACFLMRLFSFEVRDEVDGIVKRGRVRSIGARCGQGQSAKWKSCTTMISAVTGTISTGAGSASFHRGEDDEVGLMQPEDDMLTTR